MKKFIFLLFLAVPVLLTGCGPQPQIQPVANLVELQTEIDRISEELAADRISPEEAQLLFAQLQSKYTELTEAELLSRMQALQMTIDKKKDAKIRLGELPVWAKDLWLSLPVRMRFYPDRSHINRVDKDGYDALLYVYKWPYAYALTEAQRIASGAGLFVSTEVLEAQQLLSQWTAISGLDISDLSKGIVYLNHHLMDTKIDYLLSVSVESDGTLTVEATNYTQMKK